MLTAIVLLFLVVVPELTFALGGHATSGLLHLLGLAVAWLVVSLSCVVALEVGGRVGAHRVEFGHGLMALRHASHTRFLRKTSAIHGEPRCKAETYRGQNTF